MKDRAKGKDVDPPTPPLAYLIMVWRRKMGVGYLEALQTPFPVIMKDLEMMDLEAEFGPNSGIMEGKQE